jgi:hypothetical protein
MKSRSTTIITIVILLLIVAGGVYWYLFFYGKGNVVTPVVTGSRPSNGFTPFSTAPGTTGGGETTTNNTNDNQNQTTSGTTTNSGTPIPSLRLLSNTPIGGYGASTTATTTIVRWVDRGRGNVFEAKGDTLEIATLSNTILPRMYSSVWNKNITAFIGSILTSNSDIPTTVYAQIRLQATPTPIPTPNPKQKTASSTVATSTNKTASSTDYLISTSENAAAISNLTPYELKGKNLPDNMIGYAVSPKGDKIFMMVKENKAGVGYIANFDGTSVVKILSTPLTQVNVEWPEETTIAITTKGTANLSGFLYFINTKTGAWKKVLGPTPGLSTKVSKDAKFVLASATNKNGSISTNIYKIGTTTPLDTTITTLADKCIWGNFYKEVVYCAVPSQIETAIYPDDWYKGLVSFTDKIWQVNVLTNEVHLVTTIVDQSDRIIDVFNLGLDPKDDFLFFMNKNDLSFWSFDLNAKQ